MRNTVNSDLISKRLAALELRTPSIDGVFYPNSAYRSICERIVQAVVSQGSESLLLWPKSPKGLSTSHFLLQLALMSESSIGIEECDLQTLFFPFGRSMYSCKDVHIDRKWILNVVRTRFPMLSADQREDVLFATCLTLLRLNDPDDAKAARDGETFFHPIVDELSLTYNLTTSEKKTLLYKTKKYTGLKNNKLNRGELADDPSTALWCLTGLDKECRFIDNLRRKPDIFLLDLTRRSVPWKNFNSSIEKPLNLLKKKFEGSVPVLAITDIPWVHERMKNFILPNYNKAPKAITSVVRYNKIQSMTGVDSVEELEGFEKVWVTATDAGVGAFLKQLKAFAQKIEKEDFELSNTLMTCYDRIGNRINFPVSYDTLRQYIGEVSEDADDNSGILESCMPRFRVADYTSITAQKNESVLKELENHVRVLNQSTSVSTVYALIRTTILNFLKRPTKTAFVFQEKFFSEIVKYSIVCDAQSQTELSEYIESGMLSFLDKGQFNELALNPSSRLVNVIFVQASKDAIMDIITYPQLPNEMIFIGTGEGFKFLYSELKTLIGYTETQVLHKRMKLLADAIGRTAVPLSSAIKLSDDGPIDFHFKFESTDIDLRGSNSAGPFLKIRTASGQNILASKGAEIIVYDRDNPVNPFSSTTAEYIENEMEICPIGDNFIQTARESIYSRIPAAPEVREYHKAVAACLLNINGNDIRSKANSIHREMIKKIPNKKLGVYSVIEWINVNKWLNDDLNVLRPNAPKTWPMFRIFMEVLGIGKDAAMVYWDKGIAVTRSQRLSKGHDFHKTYIAILISPEQVELNYPQFKEVITSLRAMAERNVTVVSSKTMENF